MKKIISLTVATALIFTTSVFAQETNENSDESYQDFGFGEFDNSGEFGGFDNSGGFGGFDSTSSGGFSIGGDVIFDTRWTLQEGTYSTRPTANHDAGKTDVFPRLVLKPSYVASRSEFTASLKIDIPTIKEHIEDILEEMTIRAFLGDFVLEAGKMKVVWGKGDKVHVLDNFNANDYTDFLIPDYIDRRLAEPMIRLQWNGPKNVRMEAIYAPWMTADRYATSGIWTPATYLGLQGLMISVADNNYPPTSLTPSAILALQNQLNNATVPSFNFEYGQAGIRLLHTIGVFDWGVSYYYGHYKQPSTDLEKYLISYQMTNGKPTVQPSLHYDMLQVFGLEAATAIKMFNLRTELAYYLTNDIKGDDPWVHNNSINWLIGFDVDLPLHNININIQNVGNAVLGKDKIKDGTFKVYDVDYNSHDRYTRNRLVFNISDSFLHEKLKLECAVVWGIERREVFVKPKVTYNIVNGLDVSLTGGYIHSEEDDGEFHDYKDNGFLQLGAKYSF